MQRIAMALAKVGTMIRITAAKGAMAGFSVPPPPFAPMSQASVSALRIAGICLVRSPRAARSAYAPKTPREVSCDVCTNGLRDGLWCFGSLSYPS